MLSSSSLDDSYRGSPHATLSVGQSSAFGILHLPTNPVTAAPGAAAATATAPSTAPGTGTPPLAPGAPAWNCGLSAGAVASSSCLMSRPASRAAISTAEPRLNPTCRSTGTEKRSGGLRFRGARTGALLYPDISGTTRRYLGGSAAAARAPKWINQAPARLMKWTGTYMTCVYIMKP